eukprot:5045014-Amphidinium_carterae.1
MSMCAEASCCGKLSRALDVLAFEQKLLHLEFCSYDSLSSCNCNCVSTRSGQKQLIPFSSQNYVSCAFLELVNGRTVFVSLCRTGCKPSRQNLTGLLKFLR